MERKEDKREIPSGKGRLYLRRLGSVALFLLLAMLLLCRINDVVRRKVRRGDVVANFFREKKDSIDVLFVGSSICYSNISPMDMWNAQGVTGYALATPSQMIPCSYYLIREGIRTQHPKAVVLDTYASYYSSFVKKEGSLHQAFDDIPFGTTKLALYRELLPKVCNTFAQRFEYLFPFLKFHARWNSVREEDFHNDYAFLRGAMISFSREEAEEADITDEEEEIFSGTEEYIKRIIDLCRKEKVELVFMRIPTASYETVGHMQRTSNRMLSIGRENGVAVLDLNTPEAQEALALDYKTGFRDKHHGNSRTQRKISEYVAGWLHERYELEDHRGDPDYASWNEDYGKYLEYRSAVEAGVTHAEEDEE